MNDVYTVTWPFRPDPMEQATIPRFTSCLDEDTANEVREALSRQYPQAVVYATAVVNQ